MWKLFRNNLTLILGFVDSGWLDISLTDTTEITVTQQWQWQTDFLSLWQ